MSLTNTNIQFQRSRNELSELLDSTNGIDPVLNFGEPFFIDNTTHDSEGKILSPVNAYLAVGRKPDGDETITLSKSPVIKALTLEKADTLVFYKNKDNPYAITDEAGNGNRQ